MITRKDVAAIGGLIGSAYVAGSIALAKWSGTPMPHDPNPVWFDAMLYLSCDLAVSWFIWASWNARPVQRAQRATF